MNEDDDRVGRFETGGDGDDLVREAAEAGKAAQARLCTIEADIKASEKRLDALASQMEMIADAVAKNADEGGVADALIDKHEEAIKALQAATKQPAKDELKERFFMLKTEIDITQAAIDQLQTKVAMPNNFKLTSYDVSELVKMVEFGITHIKTCEKELNISKQALAERFIEQWKAKQEKAKEQGQ